MRFPEFEGEWEMKKLGEVADKITDGTHDTPKPVEKGIPFLTAIHIKDGFIDYENCYYLEQEVHNNIYKRCNPEKDDLLIVNIGAGTASCALNIVDYEFSLKNVALIKPNKSIIDGRFLAQIQRKNSTAIFNRLTSGGAQPFLSLKELGRLSIKYTSLSEQTKIASFLSLIDKRIATQNKIIENLKTQMLGLQNNIFTQKLKLQDCNGRKFSSWGNKKGGELFVSISNKNHNSDLPILAVTQDQGAVPRDLIDYQITVTERSVESYKVVEIGDFIISLRSFQGGIEHSDYKGICSPAYIILKNRVEIVTKFYKYYFKTPSYIKLLNKKLEGIRDGKMISYSYFAEIPIPFPTFEEQQRIASFLSSLEEKIHTEKAIIEKLTKQKQYLLQQLFV